MMFEGPELLQDVTAIDKESDKEKKKLFHSFKAHFHLREDGLKLCNV